MSTPGPWRRGQVGNRRIYGPDGQGEHAGLIAQVFRLKDVPLILSAPCLLVACKAKLSDCRENGDCSDAALMPGECCSDECAAMTAAVEKAEGKAQ